ncbi:MAG: formate dehydrogenase [Rubrivivax sp.]|nr:formate dehydrogenase [Rubrivivax sp.]
MNQKRNDSPNDSASAPLSRRRLFAGAGTAGAVAVVAAVLPGAKSAAPVAASVAPPSAEGGYRLSEHVKRYYETARV